MQNTAQATEHAVSRRSFLKGAAASAVALAGASGAAGVVNAFEPVPAMAEVVEQKLNSFCRCNCGDAGCALELTVRDGNITFVQPKIFADADPVTKGRSRGCMRGISNVQREYDPDRLMHPMRRAGERGEGKWEQITWEEAIKEVADKWTGYSKEFGPASVALWTSFGSLANLHGTFGSVWSRLAYFTGSSSIVVGADWSNMYTAPFHFGTLFFGPSNSAMKGNTKNFIAWGENTAESYHHTWRYVAEAQAAGTNLIVIDPRVSMTAAKADYHFAIRPGSDAALALGLANYVFANKLYDQKFLTTYTDAPLLVRDDDGMYLTSGNDDAKAYLVWDEDSKSAVPAAEAKKPALFGTFTADGVKCTTVLSLFKERTDEWTLDKTAEVTELTKEQIEQLAGFVVNGPTTIKTGFGFGHFRNSHTATSAVASLVILTGNIGKPGAGYGFYMSDERFVVNDYYGYPEAANVQTSTTGAVDLGEGVVNQRGPAYSVLKLAELMETNKYAGEDATIKMAVMHASNALANTPGRVALMEAVDKIETFVVIDSFLSESAQHADIVLPAAFWFEEDEIIKPSRQHYLEYAPLAVEPQGECKSDFEICRLIGTAMGFGDQYQEEALDVLRKMVDDSNTVDVNGDKVTFERLEKEGQIRLAPDDAYNTLDGIGTATGRLQFYIEQPAPRVPWGEDLDPRDHLAYFDPPEEAWPEDAGGYKANPLAEKYPLVFYSMHHRWRVHTSFYNARWIEELMPEPRMSINPVDAAARGIEEGDMVRAYNDRGYVVVRARIDSAMRPGTVNLPHGWQEQDFVEGHYSDLSSNTSNPFDANENYYDCLCEVEKVG